MNPKYVDVSLRADLDSGELIAMLREEEPLGSWEQDRILHFVWPQGRWRPAILEDFKRSLACLGFDVREVDLAVAGFDDQDWSAVWASSLQPVLIGKRIRIRQSWNPVDPEFGGIELVIDPQRAFGAGYHATTQMILEWLQDCIRGGERILDVGTGTGILAMAALRLGAVSAVAIDNDPVAIECAREYARMNGFGAELDLRIESFETARFEGFDLAMANLDVRALPSLCSSLPGMLKSGASACLSGLQIQDYEEAAAGLIGAGLAIGGRFEREEWLALEVKKRR